MSALIRFLAWALALIVVTLPVVAVLNGWIAADHWPIQRLRLTADYQRVTAEQVRGALAPQIGRGFFAIDLREVRTAVAGLPWVQQVEVRKRWPDLIEITLIEHRPYARWGGDLLLSDRGDLFNAPGGDDLQGLPLLDGPAARVADVVALHNQAQRLFSGAGLAVSGLQLSARGSWSLTLANGARVVIGRDEPEARLGRFVRLLPRLLAGQPRPFERVDLRYTNGFAVQWGEEPGIGNGESGIDGATAPDLAPAVTDPQAALSIPDSPFSIPGLTA